MRNLFFISALTALFFLVLTGLILYKVLLIANLAFLSSVWTAYGLIATIFLVSRIPYAYLHRDDHTNVYTDAEYPTVSIIIAAKNEEAGITRTIETCLASEYPSAIEVIVIDDGSTDNTNEAVSAVVDRYPTRVKLITFAVNQGKREAMAVGIHESQHDLLVFVDSDSFLKPNAVRHVAEHFMADQRIGAVAGNTKVENADVNVLTKMQSIQYAVSFDIYKASESVHQSVTCCPGCFSAYRASAVRPLAREWKNQRFLGIKATFGDDRALTNFILKNWDIVYCPSAQATTVVPEKFRVYWKQQLRWKKSWVREGLFAGLFMWKRHPMASFAFYTNYSFPFVGPILTGFVLVQSVVTQNPALFLIFITGFMLLGLMFALFARIYLHAKYWYYMPVFSILFVSVFMWQMPYAILTLQKTHWGTR